MPACNNAYFYTNTVRTLMNHTTSWCIDQYRTIWFAAISLSCLSRVKWLFMSHLNMRILGGKKE